MIITSRSIHCSVISFRSTMRLVRTLIIYFRRICILITRRRNTPALKKKKIIKLRTALSSSARGQKLQSDLFIAHPFINDLRCLRDWKLNDTPDRITLLYYIINHVRKIGTLNVNQQFTAALNVSDLAKSGVKLLQY